MTRYLYKELHLAASPISWWFLAGALMTLLPGYPILVGSFFICFGVFQSFQHARESNDVLYSVLLPVKKRDYVTAKYLYTVFMQMIGWVLCAVLTVLRMTALSNLTPYVGNALMNPSPLYLGFVLLIFTAFNVLFLGGFFRTAYKFGLPFLRFGIAALLLISIAEVLHHLPGLGFLNTTTGERLGLQFAILGGCALIYALCTLLSLRASQKRFEMLDL